MTVRELYDLGVRVLRAAGLPDPETDVRALVAAPLRLNRNDLFLHRDRRVSPLAAWRIKRNMSRREKLEPVAYILGYKDFFHDRFRVNRSCLIPRADTEHILYAVQESGRVFQNCLDAGTGSGALAVSLCRLYPDAAVTAVDIHLSCARQNARRLRARNLRLRKIDFLKSAHRLKGPYDLVVSNPPYLSREDFSLLGPEARLYEPARAFAGGPDGLDFYRAIAAFCRDRLTPDGWIVVETDHKWKEVLEIFCRAGFSETAVRKDYNGLERVITARRPARS